ncbi:MAG: hypothetical protein ABII13_01185 [Patescibacteria group bacterium]
MSLQALQALSTMPPRPELPAENLYRDQKHEQREDPYDPSASSLSERSWSKETPVYAIDLATQDDEQQHNAAPIIQCCIQPLQKPNKRLGSHTSSSIIGHNMYRINLARYLFERAGEIASLIVCLARLVRHPHSLIRANEGLD